ncbi:hypothetical protein H0H93_004233, partial [Arthromyces matolae]
SGSEHRNGKNDVDDNFYDDSTVNHGNATWNNDVGEDWTVENEGNIEEDAFRGREGASNHATHASAEAELAK